KNHIELFRAENVPLETEEAKLSQTYQKLSGSLTVIFRGEERTLVQMGRYLEEPDRALRRKLGKWWPTGGCSNPRSSRKFLTNKSSCGSKWRRTRASKITAI